MEGEADTGQSQGETRQKDRTENTESEPGRVAVRKGMAHGKGNKKQSQY